MAKPPSTRHTVMPMSYRKPCLASRSTPERTIVSGSARKVLDTSPPKVTAAQAAKNTTKKARPSAIRAPGATGCSGLMLWAPSPLRGEGWGEGRLRSLEEAGVRQLRHVRHLLDDAGLEQQVRRFLAERSVLAGEELLVGRPVLPAQVILAGFEGFTALLDVGPHDLEAFLRLLLDHLHGLEVAVRQRLGRFRVLAQELG